MLEFDAARQRVLDSGSPLPAERVELAQALGRVLREDLATSGPLPPFDYSAMDGYCLATGDLAGAPPYELPVTGESRTGHACPPFTRGAAMRIFTGAKVPAGADCVVIQENTERVEDRVRILNMPRPGEHIRNRGEDLAAGQVALRNGTRLGPFQLGLAAALDRGTLLVSRRPRVVVLATGDELRAPGSTGAAETIPESNSVTVAALSTLAGATVETGLRLGDDLERTTEVLLSAFDRADVVITIGGMSVGDHDLVRPALARAGVELDFWKVAIQPGKPFAFGRKKASRPAEGGRQARDSRPAEGGRQARDSPPGAGSPRAQEGFVLGLPGNPVSAQLTFLLFGLPLLRALQGDRAPLPATFSVELAEPLTRKPGRLGVYRARLEGQRARITGNQSSGATTSLASADVLLFVEAEASELAAGTVLTAIRLDAC
jgi:molybdopterin molybdotransferase